MLCGAAQTEPRLGERDRNLEGCLARLEEAAAAGCDLVVFPECASSGYVFRERGRGRPRRRGGPGPSTELGTRLAEAGETEEGLVTAEIDTATAREKDRAIVPGEYEVHLFGDRRPELYGDLVAQAEPVHTS
jgi:predicted amidohydrolase